jgi:hypothetical protein
MEDVGSGSVDIMHPCLMAIEESSNALQIDYQDVHARRK